MNQVPGHSARSLTYGSIMLRVHSGYRASETESDVTRDSKVSSPLDSFRCERLSVQCCLCTHEILQKDIDVTKEELAWNFG